MRLQRGVILVALLLATSCKGSEPRSTSAGSATGGSASGSATAAAESVLRNPRVPDRSAGFGEALAISADGSTLAVSAWATPSAGAEDVPDDFTGAVYVYAREGDAWRQTASLVGSTRGAQYGRGLALSGDGRILAVGAPGDSGTPGEAVFVLERREATWQEVATLVPSPEERGEFGMQVAVSGTGDVIAVSASKAAAGAVHVYARDKTGGWNQQATIAGDERRDGFGHRFALDASGTRLVVAAPFASGSRGVVTAWDRSGDAWREAGRLGPTEGLADFLFGGNVALSPDGTLAAVAASRDGGNAMVYVFRRASVGWEPAGHLAASDGTEQDRFGEALAVTNDRRVYVGASHAGPKLTGKVYRFAPGDGAAWSETIVPTPAEAIAFGTSLARSIEPAALVVATSETVQLVRE